MDRPATYFDACAMLAILEDDLRRDDEARRVLETAGRQAEADANLAQTIPKAQVRLRWHRWATELQKEEIARYGRAYRYTRPPGSIHPPVPPPVPPCAVGDSASRPASVPAGTQGHGRLSPSSVCAACGRADTSQADQDRQESADGAAGSGACGLEKLLSLFKSGESYQRLTK